MAIGLRSCDAPRIVELPNRKPLRKVAKALAPSKTQSWLRAHRYLLCWPPVGYVRFGSLRRVTPVSDNFGYDRGLPIDRHYIERFLADHASCIHGAGLEFMDDSYLKRFGGSALTSTDVMNYESDRPGTTLVADLADAAQLPLERFDVIVCTGVVQLVFDIDAAVRNIHAMLRPGGTALVTMPGITRVAHGPGWTDHWRLTANSARSLFARAFGEGQVEVVAYGNPLVAAAFLMGLAVQDLRPRELVAKHPDFELLVAVRATRTE